MTELSPFKLDLAVSLNAADTPRTLTSAIYRDVRTGIISGRYAASEKLRVGSMAKQYRVSLGAVREALSRLVADGLVLASDQRGFRVAPVSLADLEDLTDTRIELESLALRRSIANGDLVWERALKAALDRLLAAPYAPFVERPAQYHLWASAHARFHFALIGSCGLEWVLRFCATLFEQNERYRQLGSALDSTTRDDVSEHLRIFEATINRDAEAATRELTDHYRLTAARVTRCLSAAEQVSANALTGARPIAGTRPSTRAGRRERPKSKSFSGELS